MHKSIFLLVGSFLLSIVSINAGSLLSDCLRGNDQKAKHVAGEGDIAWTNKKPFKRKSYQGPTGNVVSLKHQNSDRSYRIHVPESCHAKDRIPLVVFLHGGGGNAAKASAMGLTPLADQYGFIAVYPNAVDSHWNDGRDADLFREHDSRYDDADFIRQIVKNVKADYPIDEQKTFAMGVSNGGFMAQRLAMEQSETFTAIGVIVASMAKAIKKDFAPEHPVSVVFMNGTDDPLVPYGGGPIVIDVFPQVRKRRGIPLPDRGECLSVVDAMDLWKTKNNISGKPRIKNYEDRNEADGTSAARVLWDGGIQGTAVAQIQIRGGGHTVPGDINASTRKKFVGKINMDIDGLEEVWKFLNQHHRKVR